MSKRPLFAGPAAILLGALCASTSGTAQALAPEGTTPLGIGCVRLLGGGLLMLCLSMMSGKFPNIGLLIHKGYLWRLLCATAGLAGYQILFFQACLMSGVANTTVISIGASPIVVGLLGWLLLKERPDMGWFFATLLAIAGLSLLTFSHGFTLAGNSPLGNLLALLAACSYGFYLVLLKPLVFVLPSSQVITIVLLIGGLALLPATPIHSFEWILSVRGACVAADLAVVTTSLSFSLVLWGMRTTSAAVASTLGLAEPFCAALLGIYLLHESVNLVALCGMGILFFSMMIIVLSEQRGSKSAQGK